MTLPNSLSQADAFWESHIERWRASHLSQWAYCKQERLTYATFIRKRKQILIGGLPEKKRFIAVSVREDKKERMTVISPSATVHHIEIILASGHTVRLPTNIPTQDIASLIRLLGESHA